MPQATPLSTVLGRKTVLSSLAFALMHGKNIITTSHAQEFNLVA